MRCAFSVEVGGWEPGRDAMGAWAALRARGLGADADACKRIQEVGAWVLDTMWTVLLTNSGVIRPSVQYSAVPNNVYAHMKGDFEA